MSDDKVEMLIFTLRFERDERNGVFRRVYTSSICRYSTYTPKPKDERLPWDDIKRVNIRDANAARSTLFDLVDER